MHNDGSTIGRCSAAGMQKQMSTSSVDEVESRLDYSSVVQELRLSWLEPACNYWHLLDPLLQLFDWHWLLAVQLAPLPPQTNGCERGRGGKCTSTTANWQHSVVAL